MLVLLLPCPIAIAGAEWKIFTPEGRGAGTAPRRDAQALCHEARSSGGDSEVRRCVNGAEEWRRE